MKTLSFQTKICLVIFLLFAIKAVTVFDFEEVGFFREIQSWITEQSAAVSEKEKKGEEEEIAECMTGDKTEEKQGIVQSAEQTIEEPEVAVRITDSSGNPAHESLCLTGTDDFAVVSSLGEEEYEKGTILDLREYFAEKNIDSCLVMLEASLEEQAVYTKDSNDESGKTAAVSGIQCLSFQKDGSSPVYPGTLQIQWDGEKQVFYMVNRLKMEWYLPGVVSAEMPDSFGLEALKTQAVCARSYALSVLEQESENPQNESQKDGISWDLEDTTDDQVYMSGSVDWQAVQACLETSGQVLFQNGKTVKPHYYSTSWGEAADGAVFSGKDVQMVKASAVSLSKESIDAMNKEFIQTYQALEVSYDRISPWFRWTCCISLSQLWEKAVEEIWVTKRGTGGYASELLIFYEDGTAEQISGANAIREKLGAKGTVYHLQDGSTRKGLSILPSAFFYLEDLETSGGEVMVQMHGGGFGHGFGVSQYGTAQMAEEGDSYQDILEYYYDEAEIYRYY